MDKAKAAEILRKALPHQGSELMEALCFAGLAALGEKAPIAVAPEPAPKKGKSSKKK